MILDEQSNLSCLDQGLKRKSILRGANRVNVRVQLYKTIFLITENIGVYLIISRRG